MQLRTQKVIIGCVIAALEQHYYYNMAAAVSGKKRRGARGTTGGAPPRAAAAAARHAREAEIGLGEVPLFVQLLAGNLVTGVEVWGCLNAADIHALRRLHPAIAAAAVGLPIDDTVTPVSDVVRWRAVLPAAVGVKLAQLPVAEKADMAAAAAALAGVTSLDLTACHDVSSAVVAYLPTSLQWLTVENVRGLHASTRFARFSALVSLNCSGTDALANAAGVGSLPPSLRELRIVGCRMPALARFNHLSALRRLDCGDVNFSGTTIASLPPSLEELHTASGSAAPWPRGGSVAHLVNLRVFRAAHSGDFDVPLTTLPSSLHVLDVSRCRFKPDASFAHIHNLQALHVRGTPFGNAALATLPPTLVTLDAHGCEKLTPAAVFPALPALRVLNVSGTGINDHVVTRLPRGLVELHIANCKGVTHAASFRHLAALRELHASGTQVSRSALASLRAAGCLARADGVYRYSGYEYDSDSPVSTLAVLGDGRLLSSRDGTWVTTWTLSDRGNQEVVHVDSKVRALAVMPDGHRVAVGMATYTIRQKAEGVVVWDATADSSSEPPLIDCGGGVAALAVLSASQVAAGGRDGVVHVVDVDAGALAATFERVKCSAYSRVSALAVVAGLLAGAVDDVVHLWDITTRAHVGALMTDHRNGSVSALAALADGRRVASSGDWNNSVCLWDTATRTCVGVLKPPSGLRGGFCSMYALVGLPDGRLATGSEDTNVYVWDTRAAGPGRSLAPVAVLEGHSKAVSALLALPGGRLVSGSIGGIRLWQL